MKSFNKYLNILNILYIIILYLMPSSLYYYDTLIWTWRISFYVIGFMNIIVGIFNLKKKNKCIGIISIIIGITIIGLSIIKHTDIRYKLSDDMITIFTLLEDVIIFICSIVNLVKNRKVQQTSKKIYALIIFIFFIISNIGIGVATNIIHSDNIKNFDEVLINLQNQGNIDTYAIEMYDTKEWVFINNDGKEINRKKYDNIFGSFHEYNMGDKVIKFAWGEIDKDIVLIDATGEQLWKVNGLKDELKLGEFMKDIIKSQNYNMELLPSTTYISIPKYNYLEKYNESNKKFEDNENYKYSYFKNNKFTNNVLQIVIKDELESDNELINNYTEFNNEHNNYDFYRDTDKIEEFYKYKKEYYLINFNNNTRAKLECNNLIYDAESFDNGEKTIEKIVLFTNGNIPFYDKTENGCFNQEGQKISVNSNYLLYDTTNEYIAIMDRTIKNTHLISNETREEIKLLDGILIKYDGFYILRSNKNNEIELMDNNLNVLATTDDEINFIGNTLFEIDDKYKYIDYLYCYNNGILKLLYSSDDVGYFYIKDLQYSEKVYSTDVYSNIGIIE